MFNRESNIQIYTKIIDISQVDKYTVPRSDFDYIFSFVNILTGANLEESQRYYYTITTSLKIEPFEEGYVHESGFNVNVTY